MEQEERKSGFNSCQLKVIAAGAMLCSHIYRALLYGRTEWLFLDIIGRISFPLFAFLLAEGFCRTKSRIRYLLRLWIAAVMSEIPFDMLFYNQLVAPKTQNVLFTMCIALAALCGVQWMEKHHRQLCMLPVAAGMAVAWLLRTDYSFWGVWVIVCFYMLRGMRRECALIQTGNMLLSVCFFGSLQLAAVLSIPFYAFYNGERGMRLKYFFYLFYPLHLLVLYGIRVL